MDRNGGENAPKSLTHAQKSQFNAIPMGSRYIYTHVNNRWVIASGTILQNQPQHARRFCSGLRQRRGGDYADSSVNPARLLPSVEAQLRVVLPDLILLIKLLSENEGFTTDIVILPMAYNRISD